MAIALSLAFTPTPVAAGNKVVIDATKQLSPGVSFVPRSAYKNVYVGAAASASPANILAAYTAIYGALISGQKIFFRVYAVNAQGFASTPVEVSAVVV